MLLSVDSACVLGGGGPEEEEGEGEEEELAVEEEHFFAVKKEIQNRIPDRFIGWILYIQCTNLLDHVIYLFIF